MQHQCISTTGLRRRAIAAAAAALFAPFAQAQATSAAVDEQEAALGGSGHGNSVVYSVINMGPEAGAASLLNERGQAAFGSYTSYGPVHGFFDGDRIYPIGTLGGSYTSLGNLNNHGVVVGDSEDGEEHSNILAFTWTLAGGMRALPGLSVSTAHDINDRNYIAGLTSEPGISARAVRWNPNRGITPLGQLPPSLSEARAINEQGFSAGYSDVASGQIHAMLWDRNGYATDLGTLGGDLAFGMHINDRNEVAGESSTAANDRTLGFFWSRNSGMVAIGAEGGGSRLVADLNNRGEVVGDTMIDGSTHAYLWSLRRGLSPLPSGSAIYSDVFDINNHGEMVGAIERPPAEGGDQRAVRWPALTAPVDLNTRLYRPPAGLVLRAGAAINDAGVILAHSNAGLVMLRPGKRGTDAPVLGPLVGFPDTLEVGQDLALTVGFVDNVPWQTYKTAASWNDECPSPPPTVRAARGVGQVSLRHQLCAAGFFTVKVQLADSGGRSTEIWQEIVVEAPGLASLSGKGSLGYDAAPAARGYRNLPLRFALWAPLGDGAAKARAGAPVVSFSGPFLFRSEQVTTATAGAQQARLEGTGRLNGRAGYRFLVEAQDGGKQAAGPDRLRVRVTHVDAATGAEMVDYDNGAAAGARATAGIDRTAVMEGGLRLRN